MHASVTGGVMPPKLSEDADSVRLQMVAPVDWLARIDNWRRKQTAIPNRSEAIRLLVDKALEAKE